MQRINEIRFNPPKMPARIKKDLAKYSRNSNEIFNLTQQKPTGDKFESVFDLTDAVTLFELNRTHKQTKGKILVNREEFNKQF